MFKKPLIRKSRKALFVLLIPRFEDLGNSFYSGEITRGVNLAANRLDVDILVHFVNRKDHTQWLHGLMDPQFIDGMIFADIDRDWDIVKKAIKAGVPTIVLNNTSEDPFNCIAIDNKEAAKQAVKTLFKMGHQKIAHIAGDLSTQAGQDRLKGYEEAFKEAQLEVDKRYIKKGGFLRSPAKTATQALLALEQCPTAIFAGSDLMALEAIDVIKSQGLNVPDDISVIGFDNNLTTIESPIHLSTFEQPIVDMGRMGVEFLYQVSLGLVKLPVKVSLPARFIKGKTLKAL